MTLCICYLINALQFLVYSTSAEFSEKASLETVENLTNYFHVKWKYFPQQKDDRRGELYFCQSCCRHAFYDIQRQQLLCFKFSYTATSELKLEARLKFHRLNDYASNATYWQRNTCSIPLQWIATNVCNCSRTASVVSASNKSAVRTDILTITKFFLKDCYCFQKI